MVSFRRSVDETDVALGVKKAHEMYPQLAGNVMVITGHHGSYGMRWSESWKKDSGLQDHEFTAQDIVSMEQYILQTQPLSVQIVDLSNSPKIRAVFDHYDNIVKSSPKGQSTDFKYHTISTLKPDTLPAEDKAPAIMKMINTLLKGYRPTLVVLASCFSAHWTSSDSPKGIARLLEQDLAAHTLQKVFKQKFTERGRKAALGKSSAAEAQATSIAGTMYCGTGVEIPTECPAGASAMQELADAIEKKDLCNKWSKNFAKFCRPPVKLFRDFIKSTGWPADQAQFNWENVDGTDAALKIDSIDAVKTYLVGYGMKRLDIADFGRSVTTGKNAEKTVEFLAAYARIAAS